MHPCRIRVDFSALFLLLLGWGGDDVLCFKIQYDEVLRQEVVD